MKKTLLPLMIVSILPVAAFADVADVVVYGKANLSWQYADKNVGGGYPEVVNNASRLGFKGNEAINDDLNVIYQLEYEARPDDGSGPFAQRNSFVGLQGLYGTGMIGMFDTPLKQAQEKVDLFNDLVGDLKVVLEGENRAKNIVQYSTPSINNITANIAFVNTEQNKRNVKNGFSASVVYGTKTIYAAIANDHNVKNAMEKTTPVDDTDIIRAVGRYSVGPVVLGVMLEHYNSVLIDENGFLTSAQWNLDNKWSLKAQYGASDMIHVGGIDASVGVDYKLSKAAKLFGYYTKIQDDRVEVIRANDNYLGAGIELNF